MLVVQGLAFIFGLAIVVRTALSAVRTFVVPRGHDDRLTGFAFRAVRWVFETLAAPRRSYAFRDRVMAYYGPVSLMLLPAWWLALICVGYTAMFWAIGVPTLPEAFVDSGSSLLTLGFARPSVPGGDALAFSAAALGLALVALLVSYLPTIYAAFSRRELLVSLLEVRADTPPSPVVMLTRLHRLRGLAALGETWERWEQWFADVEESHTSLPVLVFYRSQQAGHSWVNAAGAMMDAAAIVRSAVAIPMDVRADLMIRAGYLALRRIAGLHGVAFDPDPSPGDPTSVDRGRFETALDVIAGAGVPIVDDRDQAWRDFNGWRVNYDTVLRALERLTMAPTPWWERPMLSAYVTDEPDEAARSAEAGQPVPAGEPVPVGRPADGERSGDATPAS